MKSAKQILEEVEAAKKLQAMGYVQQPCAHCHGLGYFLLPRPPGECPWCKGTGKGEWRGPMVSKLEGKR